MGIMSKSDDHRPNDLYDKSIGMSGLKNGNAVKVNDKKVRSVESEEGFPVCPYCGARL